MFSHTWKLLIGLALASGCRGADTQGVPPTAEALSFQHELDQAEQYLVHLRMQDAAQPDAAAQPAAKTQPTESKQPPAGAQAPADENKQANEPAAAADNATATDNAAARQGSQAKEPAGKKTAGEEPAGKEAEGAKTEGKEPAGQEPNAEQALQDALTALREARQAVDADDNAKAVTALRQAITSLQTARVEPAPGPRPKDCCRVYAPRDCPPTACTEVGDACVIVRMPSIDSRNPSFTAKGVYAFSELFTAATARGIENATVRAMNATKVCPIPPCDPQGETTH